MSPRWRVIIALLAVVVLNLPLGTIYAFSVFLRPLEQALAVGRAELSFVFGLAVASFTLGMNLAPLLYRFGHASLLVGVCTALAALGIGLSALAQAFWQLVLGYGVLFGLGGGLAYVLLLQGVNMLLQGSRGLVNGFIVSLYPFGAMIGAPLFGWALGEWGLRPTLWGLAATLCASAVVTGLLSRASGLQLRGEAAQATTPAPRLDGVFWRLAAVFFLAAAAGLMVLGQAAGMIEAYGGGKSLALFATTFITGCIASARIGGGWLADRLAAPLVMVGAHLLAMAGGILLLLIPGPQLAVATLAMIGMGYGLVSGSTVAAISVYWGAEHYGRIAGRTYIAWCVGAITLPVVAGRLFDLTGGYAGAVMIAVTGNMLGALIAWGMPRQRAEASPAPAR